MTELWVTLMAAGAWALGASLAGVAGSFLVQRLGDRRLAMRVAKEHLGPRGAERPVTAERGVEPAASSALAFAGAGAPSFADREMAHATSTTT